MLSIKADELHVKVICITGQIFYLCIKKNAPVVSATRKFRKIDIHNNIDIHLKEQSILILHIVYCSKIKVI